MLKFHCSIYVFLGLFLHAVPVPAVQVPIDESDAFVRLADGTLDSAFWMKIAPFYEAPVVVEKGNLAVLADIIPEYAEDLPSRTILLAYMPWSASSVRRFLNDYPYLADLSPILVFDTTQHATIGRVKVTLPRQLAVSASRVTTHFFIEPADGFGAEGRLYTDTSGVSWGRRRLVVPLPGTGALSVGNIQPEHYSALFLGSFSTESFVDTLQMDQFLFGSTATWNGVMWMQKWGSAVHSEILFHSRLHEKALSLQVMPVLAPGVRADIGVSGLSAGTDTTSTDTTYALNAGVEVVHREWSARAHSCITSRDAGSVPFTFAMGHRGLDQRISLFGVFIPQGFSGNRSQLVQTVSSMTGNDAPEQEILWIGADYTRKAFPSAVSTVSISFIRHGLSSYGRASVVLAGNQPFEYRFHYTCTASEQRDIRYYMRHEATSTGSVRIDPRVLVKVNGAVASSPETINYRGRISLPISLNQALTVEPFFQARLTTASGARFNVGLRQELDLARNVKGVCILDTPCFPWSANLTAIALASSFLF